MKRFYFILSLSFVLSLQTHAFNLQSEIQQLNQDFGQVMGYPILVFDKNEIRRQLSPASRGPQAREQDIVADLKRIVQKDFALTLTDNEAINIVPYISTLKGSAVSLPFFNNDRSTKLCVVLPSDNDGDHLSEVKRVLGVEPTLDIYKDFDLERAKKLLSLEELRLFSLYHELSHCLDQAYTPRLYSEPDAHTIHQGETFAEVNALFLLNQRKGLRNLGIPRALLRGIYSKYYGPYLAQQPPSLAGEAYNKGGSVYFLSIPLIKAQLQIENYSIRVSELSLPATINLSRSIVEAHSVHSRSFTALHMMFAKGEAEALRNYQKMAQDHPDLFFAAYNDLLYFRSFFHTLESLLPR